MKSRLLHIIPGPSATIRSTLPALTTYQPSLCLRLQKRFITANEKPLPEADKSGPGPNQEQLPHVSEEAAATDKIMGEDGPDIEQGTPVQEILKRDENSHVKPPRIIQEEIQKSSPKGARPFSTTAKTRQRGLMQSSRSDSQSLQEFLGLPNKGLARSVSAEIENEIENEGLARYKSVENGSLSESQLSAAKRNAAHIFDLPTLPLPKNDRLKERYDPLILQLTNLLMHDGKKGLAQRNMALILHYLRTTAPPRPNPIRALLNNPIAVARLPLDPVSYVRLAIDSIAPLLQLKSRFAGGGQRVQVPIPLNERQRRRAAIMWILDAVDKRRSKGSGRTRFAHKVGEELVAIVEGRSALWDRRGQLHKLGIASRSNMLQRRR